MFSFICFFRFHGEGTLYFPEGSKYSGVWENGKCIKVNVPDFIVDCFFAQPAMTCSKLTIETLEQRCEICSKLTIKTPKRRHWHRFGVFIVIFERISHLCSSLSIVNFEEVNAG